MGLASIVREVELRGLLTKGFRSGFLRTLWEFTLRSVVFKLKDGPLLTSTLLLGRGLLRKLRFVRLFST